MTKTNPTHKKDLTGNKRGLTARAAKFLEQRLSDDFERDIVALFPDYKGPEATPDGATDKRTTVADKIAAAVACAAMNGEEWAVKLLWDRIDGKVLLRHDLTTGGDKLPDGKPGIIVATQKGADLLKSLLKGESIAAPENDADRNLGA